MQLNQLLIKYTLIIFFILIPLHSFSESNENAAGVYWVTFDNRFDFQEAHEIISNALCCETGFFNMPKENLFTVPMKAELKNGDHSFGTYLDMALKSIEGKNNPHLVIAIKSHGEKGFVCKQGMTSISHNDLIDVIINKAKQFEKSNKSILHLTILYDACNSGSIVDELERKLQNEDGRFSNGQNKYSFKIDLLAAANKDDVAWLNNMWSAIKLLNDLHSLKNQQCSISTESMCTFQCIGTQTVWSSYRNIPKKNREKAFSKEEISQIIKLLKTSKTKEDKRYTIKIIQKIGPDELKQKSV